MPAATAGAELRSLRQTVARLADQHGLAPIAASTHPFARWSTQQPTERERYQAIAQDLAGVGRRLVICGMHVHVGIDDDELRIDLMNQARYFLPHLLVLSTSSPFAEGEDTGLKCYRLAAYQELPRTGLPGRFESWEEYRQTVDVLVRNKVIEKKLALEARIRDMKVMSKALDQLIADCSNDGRPAEDCAILAALGGRSSGADR